MSALPETQDAAVKPDWNALADKLEGIAEELMTAAPGAPDETERQLMELHAISVRHIARRLRLFPEEPVIAPAR
jgi:hypothetical protein